MLWAAFAIVLILAWPSFEDYRDASARDSVHASSSATPSSIVTHAAIQSPSEKGLPSRALSPALHPQISLIQIHQGQSLYKLCAEAFGERRQEEIGEMFKIYLAIHNSSRIKSGQWISIPVRPSDSIDKR
jgi:thymidylate synthase ThyX